MASFPSTNAAGSDPSSGALSPRAARHPWTHVVGGDPEASATVPPSPTFTPLPPPAAVIPSAVSSDRFPQKPPPEDVVASSTSEATAGVKKPVWKRPPNGSIHKGAAVMGGAASWPALAESAKAASKSQPSDALRILSDGPVPVPSGLLVSNSSPEPNPSPTSTLNYVTPERQKSMKRSGSSGGGSSGISAEGGMPLLSPPPTSGPMPKRNLDKQAPMELSPLDQTTKNTTNWDHGSRGGGLGSQAHGSGDHHRGYGRNRKLNNGGGAGSHQNNSGKRYDGYHRNAGGRDVHIQQQGARPHLRLPVPPVAAPFLSLPLQVQPFGNPMLYPDMPSPIFYVATQPPPGVVPFVPHPSIPPAMFVPAINPQRASLLNQIDYYFSSNNLCKDVYLRQNMDEQGWVPISLIAGFPRVRQLTNNIDFILETVRSSTEVEVQGEKIRKRNDWMNWVLPPSNNQFANISLQSPATMKSDNL
ncbi:la-related protein 1B isoform X1 [Musa acuminata AAA Group]|uniref:la-related protein 1B isoform X1 n=1 Tax=Musa acuminata AAA Group TaxID=214697 RepID=UPI0031E0D03A